MLALTNSTGSIVDQYSYDPYGVMTVTKQGVANPFGFGGGVEDSSTGLVKFGGRYSNPQLGRWTQMDPLTDNITDPQRLDRYALVGGPVDFVEWSGLRTAEDKVGSSIVFAGRVLSLPEPR